MDYSGSAPVREVVIDGLAVMKIVKHCNDNLPSMVAGSLLGLDNNGVLEVTYVYPFPSPQSKSDVESGEGGGAEELDGEMYQLEMMKMLQKVNVDNNCVGWYSSMYFGTMNTMDVVNYQFSYQSSEELSENCVVIMYDPIQSKNGDLVVKAFRLSQEYVEMRRNKSNEFIKTSNILIELPVKIKNSGHVSAFIKCVSDTQMDDINCDFNSLSLGGNEGFLERSLELMISSLDDLSQEQQRFQQYSRMSSKSRLDHIKWLNKRINENKERRENGERELSTDVRDASQSGLKPMPEAPNRTETLLLIGQVEKYCKQITDQADHTLNKLVVTSQVDAAVVGK
jgi:translation initiation factor 3 subunit H